MLTIIFVLFIITIATKSNVEINILRDRNVFARNVAGQKVQNSYIIKVLNKTNETRTFTLHAEGLEGLEIVNNQPFVIPAAQVYENVIRINAPRAALQNKDTHDIRLTAVPQDAAQDAASQETHFQNSKK